MARRSSAWWHLACALAVLGIGGVQAWLARYNVCSDCHFYYQMARAWEETRPGAINTFSSPLYAWMLEALDVRMRPIAGLEGQVVMLANFLALALGAAAFYVFWRQQERVQSALTQSQFILIGWGLFAWACLELMPIFDAPTDRLAAALIFTGAALLGMLNERPQSWWIFPLLGFASALAYFAKAGQFPLSLVFLASALWIVRRSPRVMLAGTLLTVLAFALLAAPWVDALSRGRGHWTFSDIGMVHYANDVEGVPDTWIGDSVHGVSKEPYVVLNRDPLVLAADAGSTSGYWEEPSRLFDGYRPRMVPERHLRYVAGNLLSVGKFMLLRGLGWIIGFALLLRAAAWSPHLSWQRAGYLLVPALSALALYLLISAQQRYLAPYIVLLAAALLAGLRAAPSRPVADAALAIMLLYLLAWTARHTAIMAQDFEGTTNRAYTIRQTIDSLTRKGLKRGDRIACLTESDRCPQMSILAGFDNRVVVSGGFERSFQNHPAERLSILSRAAALGSVGAIGRFSPGAAPAGWQPLGALDMYYYPLTRRVELP